MVRTIFLGDIQCPQCEAYYPVVNSEDTITPDSIIKITIKCGECKLHQTYKLKIPQIHYESIEEEKDNTNYQLSIEIRNRLKKYLGIIRPDQYFTQTQIKDNAFILAIKKIARPPNVRFFDDYDNLERFLDEYSATTSWLSMRLYQKNFSDNYIETTNIKQTGWEFEEWKTIGQDSNE